MAKKPKTIEHLDASIGRWKTRLKRAITMIDKLEKQRKRIEKAAANPPKPRQPKPQPMPVAATPNPTPAPTPVAEIDTSIPAFLKRPKHDPVAQEIADEQAKTKRLKARGRIEKMKAKKSGETKRMPLTGKAALDAIRNGTQ
jgi:hypothetical protein